MTGIIGFYFLTQGVPASLLLISTSTATTSLSKTLGHSWESLLSHVTVNEQKLRRRSAQRLLSLQIMTSLVQNQDALEPFSCPVQYLSTRYQHPTLRLRWEGMEEPNWVCAQHWGQGHCGRTADVTRTATCPRVTSPRRWTAQQDQMLLQTVVQVKPRERRRGSLCGIPVTVHWQVHWRGPGTAKEPPTGQGPGFLTNPEWVGYNNLKSNGWKDEGRYKGGIRGEQLIREQGSSDRYLDQWGGREQGTFQNWGGIKGNVTSTINIKLRELQEKTWKSHPNLNHAIFPRHLSLSFIHVEYHRPWQQPGKTRVCLKCLICTDYRSCWRQVIPLYSHMAEFPQLQEAMREAQGIYVCAQSIFLSLLGNHRVLEISPRSNESWQASCKFLLLFFFLIISLFQTPLLFNPFDYQPFISGHSKSNPELSLGTLYLCHESDFLSYS